MGPQFYYPDTFHHNRSERLDPESSLEPGRHTAGRQARGRHAVEALTRAIGVGATPAIRGASALAPGPSTAVGSAR